MWGESISGGRGEARRLGRRDCSMRNAIASRKLSTWTTLKELPNETYSCPASMSVRLVEHLHIWLQIVDGAELSWGARFQGRCRGLTGLVRASDMVNRRWYGAQSL